MEIKAVLFDCDGLMFDTEIIAQQIWRDGAREYGVTLPPDFFEHITGAGGQDLLDYIGGIPGAAELLKVNRKKRFDLDFWSSIHTDCLNRPGLPELFVWLNQNGYKIAVCSSSALAYVKALIATCSPSLNISPLSGWYIPESMFIRVVFPLPFSPSRQSISPLLILRLISSLATTEPNVFLMFFSSIAQFSCTVTSFFPVHEWNRR